FGADLARHAADFRREGVEAVHHCVDGLLELQDFALHIDGDLAREIAAGDRRGHVCNVPDLTGEVRGHQVDVIPKVLPRAGDTPDFGLATEFAFGANFAGDARDFGRETVELVHHRIDGVFQFEDLTANIDRNFAGKVALGDSGGHVRDIADLRREII